MTDPIQVEVEVSARHCHLSEADLTSLFGEGYQLTELKKLSEPRQFAAKETVTLKTESAEMTLRVVAPVRAATQIELSLTDSRQLKINPPVRISGDIKGSLGGLLIGPNGQVELKEGIIIAERHVHADPATAEKFGLREQSKIKVRIGGERGAVFENVAVRINEGYAFRCHLDTDEGNAVALGEANKIGELYV